MISSRNTLLLALVIIIAFNFQSCSKKYEEGPLIVLSTKKARLIGDWGVIFIENIEEVMITDGKYPIEISFKENGDFEMHEEHNLFGTPIDKTYYGRWELAREKEYIEVTRNGLTGFTFLNSYEILRLTHGELWFDYSGYGGEWRLEAKH